ncbi:MAG: Peptide deformylase [Labilithrix sp.]|nr:Peptide deformylase [Labilithrix sp.]
MSARRRKVNGPSLAVIDKPASGTHKRLLVRSVLEHPHPLLARVSVEIDPRSTAIVGLANLLVATMRVSSGCGGLAAPQIGENVRLFATTVSAHSRGGLIVLANPRILSSSGSIVMREKCASIPHLTGDVTRASEVTISGAVPGTGRHIVVTAHGVEAVCIQHAIDHLDGTLFVDRVRDPVADLFVRGT